MLRFVPPIRQQVQEYGFVVAIVFLSLLSIIGQEQFASVLICLAVVTIAVGNRPSLRGLGPVIAAFSVFLLWGTLSATWSLDPSQSLTRAGKLGALFVAALIVLRWAGQVGLPRPVRVLSIAITAHCCAVGYLVFEWIMDYPLGSQFLAAAITQEATWLVYKAGASFLLLMAVPLTAACLLRAPRLAAIPFALAAILFFLPAVSFSAKLACAAALPVGLLAFALGHRFVQAAIGLVALFVAFSPWLLASENFARFPGLWVNAPHSALHRFAIWDFVIDRAADRPRLGWGLDASRFIEGGRAVIQTDVLPEALTSLFQWKVVKEVGTAAFLPLHPHNASLQIHLELGHTGAILAAVLLFTMLQHATRLAHRLDSALILATFSALFVYGQLSTSAWHSWWIAGQVLMMALLLAAQHKGHRAS